MYPTVSLFQKATYGMHKEYGIHRSSGFFTPHIFLLFVSWDTKTAFTGSECNKEIVQSPAPLKNLQDQGIPPRSPLRPFLMGESPSCD